MASLTLFALGVSADSHLTSSAMTMTVQCRHAGPPGHLPWLILDSKIPEGRHLFSLYLCPARSQLTLNGL